MKALVGSWDHRPYHLLAEITALRSRVTELQRELDRAREENEALRGALAQSVREEVAMDVDVPVTLEPPADREVALTSTT